MIIAIKSVGISMDQLEIVDHHHTGSIMSVSDVEMLDMDKVYILKSNKNQTKISLI